MIVVLMAFSNLVGNIYWFEGISVNGIGWGLLYNP